MAKADELIDLLESVTKGIVNNSDSEYVVFDPKLDELDLFDIDGLSENDIEELSSKNKEMQIRTLGVKGVFNSTKDGKFKYKKSGDPEKIKKYKNWTKKHYGKLAKKK